MASTVPILPDPQALALERAYARMVGVRTRMTIVGVAIFLLCIVFSAVGAQIISIENWRIDANNLVKFWDNLHRFTSYFGRLMLLDNKQYVWTDFAEWYWGFWKWLRLIGETLVIAYLGTLVGAIGAFCLCFLSAENLVQSRLVQFAARRFLEFCRTVPEIVFALIFVAAFSLGPLPGVLALAIHTVGALGKLFAEVVENIDMKPVEGLKSAGATWVQTVRFAVVPQVLSNFASYGLLRFEVNVRGAAIMGFVGAGGIGHELLDAIRRFYYSDVSAILLMILAMVMTIDILTERLRHRILGAERR